MTRVFFISYQHPSHTSINNYPYLIINCLNLNHFLLFNQYLFTIKSIEDT